MVTFSRPILEHFRFCRTIWGILLHKYFRLLPCLRLLVAIPRGVLPWASLISMFALLPKRSGHQINFFLFHFRKKSSRANQWTLLRKHFFLSFLPATPLCWTLEGLFELKGRLSRALASCVAFGTTEKQGHSHVWRAWRSRSQDIVKNCWQKPWLWLCKK